MTNQATDELLALARFQRLDSRNCDEEAKDKLLGVMADEIERLRAGLNLIAIDKHRLMSVAARQAAQSLLDGKPAVDVGDKP